MSLKSSERISRLIFLAFVAGNEPVPMTDDGRALLNWSDAMELYADAVRRELRESEGYIVPGELVNDGPTSEPAEVASGPLTGFESVQLSRPAKPPDTHTHTQRGGPKSPRLTAKA